jgi:hypothetical protein
VTQKTRCAIVGTANSWKLTPWADPTLHIASLNDAYSLGLPRADEWYELHPLTHMVFRDPKAKAIKASDIPPGHYLRPAGHLEWLKAQAATIPVWLQDTPPADWPVNAQRLPVETLEAKYGTYWASGPAFMLMHLYERGFREFQVYGIHLSTEAEYREQRGNWEFLLGRLLGAEVTQRVEGRLRTYEGANGVKVVLPVECPILQHPWKYAYESKPVIEPHPYEAELKATLKEKQALVSALIQWPVGKDKTRPLERLKRLEVIEVDCRQQLAKRHVGGTLVAALAA